MFIKLMIYITQTSAGRSKTAARGAQSRIIKRTDFILSRITDLVSRIKKRIVVVHYKMFIVLIIYYVLCILFVFGVFVKFLSVLSKSFVIFLFKLGLV